jgi:hypothetical protein
MVIDEKGILNHLWIREWEKGRFRDLRWLADHGWAHGFRRFGGAGLPDGCVLRPGKEDAQVGPFEAREPLVRRRALSADESLWTTRPTRLLRSKAWHLGSSP